MKQVKCSENLVSTMDTNSHSAEYTPMRFQLFMI